MGGRLGWDGTISFVVLCCEGFPGFSGIFDLVTGAYLGSTVTL
jgi:hypothetical protein